MPTRTTGSNGNRRSLYEAPGTGSPSGYNGAATFDAEDRVARVDLADATDAFFHYDAGGQLRAKVVDSGSSTKVTKYYAPEIEVRPDGKTIKSYFLGGRRVASWLKAGSSWQTPAMAAMSWSSGVEVASLWGDRPVLQLKLSPGSETVVMTSLTLLFVALFLLPPGRRRRAVVGLRVGRGRVLLVSLVVFTGTMPWPLLIQPARAQCGGCECPPPPPPANELSYFHYDHLGSPLIITDGNGAVVEEIRYHPYGAIRARFNGAGNPIANPSPDDVRYEFTGYQAERNTGLSYANARFYDPELGSFLSHDPAAQQWSPYAYVAWDPANLTDPTGAVIGIDDAIMIAILASVVATTINGLVNGATFSQALAAGVTGAGLSAVGAFVGFAIGAAVLQPALYAAFSALPGVSAEAAGTWAVATQFVGGLGQASYSASQGDLSGLISLGLSVALGALWAKGAQASKAKTIQRFDSPQTQATTDPTIETGHQSASRGSVAIQGDVASWDATVDHLRWYPEADEFFANLYAGSYGELHVSVNYWGQTSISPSGGYLMFDPAAGTWGAAGEGISPALGLWHELGHFSVPGQTNAAWQALTAGRYTDLSEYMIIRHWDAPAADFFGAPPRFTHDSGGFRAPSVNRVH